jgi:hypothetical protein
MRRTLGLLQGELLKLRRTPALPLASIAPYVVVLLFVLFAFHSGDRLFAGGRVDPWRWLAESATRAWCWMILPLFVALETSLAGSVEHRAQGFKHLFVLPRRRLLSYFAKSGALALLLGLSFLLLGLGVLGGGLALRWLSPGLGFEATVPGLFVLLLLTRVFAACGFLLAIHTWIGLRRRDFVLPVSVGFLALVGLLVLESYAPELTRFWPWSYPGAELSAVLEGRTGSAWWLAGVLGGLGFTALAGWSFCRRDVL